jgi:hypothetical protein
VAALQGGLQIIEPATAQRPARLLGALATAASAIDLVVVDGFAYLACGRGGVAIVDVRKPDRPQPVGMVEFPDYLAPFVAPMALAAADGRLFVASGRGGFQVFSLQDPVKPQLVGALSMLGNVTDVLIRDAKAFVVDTENGLQMVDCGDLSQLRLVGALGAATKSNGLVVRGDRLFFSGGTSGIMTAPMPVPLQAARGEGQHRLRLPLPPLPQKGYYNFYLADGPKSLELPGLLYFDGKRLSVPPSWSQAPMATLPEAGR